jgi:hypothetical protein
MRGGDDLNASGSAGAAPLNRFVDPCGRAFSTWDF